MLFAMLVTLNAELILTATIVPSDLRTWASYVPPASLSTRTTVPPGTAARAAAWTFCAMVPVSAVSPDPAPELDPFVAAVVTVAALEELVEADVVD